MPEIAEPPKQSFVQKAAAMVKQAVDQPGGAQPPVSPAAIAPAPDAPNPTPAPSPAPRPEAPAAPAPHVDPDEEIISGKRSPKNEDFRRVHTYANKVTAKLEAEQKAHTEAVAKLKKLESAPKPDESKIAQAQKELEELRAFKNEIALEHLPEFHAKYDAKLTAAIGSVKGYLPAGDKAEKIISALQLPESEFKRKQLAELTEDMDEFSKTEIVAANREIRGIMSERQGELAKSQQRLSEIAQERKAQRAEHDKALSQAFESALAEASDPDKGMAVFQNRDKDDAWNQSVAERKEIARKLFHMEQLTPQERADAARWAASAPVFLEQATNLQKENADLKAQIAKLSAGGPAINGGGTTSGASKGERGGFTAKMLANTEQ